tara:strand:- start:816 stop:1373 length:558 start_codon:yes stop_codon:yes gene_type:complete
MSGFEIKDLERRMQGAITVFGEELQGLRTGRASVGLLEPIIVDAYGNSTPLNQVATISAPEPRLLTVQVWDKSLVKSVETAILAGKLGVNPVSEGQLIRVPMPELTEERRKELARVAHKYAEQARISVRNVRRDGMDSLKKEERSGSISKDEHHTISTQVQKLTDAYIAEVTEILDSKEQEILQV